MKPSDEEVFVRCFVSLLTNKESLPSFRDPKSISEIVTESPGKVFRLMVDIEYNKLGGLSPPLCSYNVLLSPVRHGANDENGGDDAA
jgi:hypothetical protein